MLNYLKKFALDVVPSVVATILGAYIVNHYITAKTATDTPPASVASTTDAGRKADPKKAAVKPAETSAETAAIPEPGVKAKGISERAMIENRAAERPSEVKPADVAKPAETASVAAEPKTTEPIKRAQTPAPKAVAKAAPTTAPAPTTAAAPATETASTSDESRDANELALEAIKRLRANGEAAPRAQDASRQNDTARQGETPRVQEPPRTAVVVPVAPAPVRPLPPPIMIATPSPQDNSVPAQPPGSPPYTASIDPNRPTPPAEIPPPRPPVDIKAEAANAMTHTKNVAEDMLSAAKSMFHAVLPGTDRQSSSASQFTE